MPNMKIVTEFGTCDVKLERISGEARKVNGKPIEMKSDGSPKLKYKDPTGTNEVLYTEMDVHSGALISGRSSCYVDGVTGKQYQKNEIVPFYIVEDTQELIPAVKNEKTEVFEVRAWEDVANYLNKYQMDAYYQVYPSSGVSKKDFAKKQAVESNTAELKKIYEHMRDKGIVGRGTLNITSAGYLPSVGYLRAVTLPDGNWTFEVAIFKENKPFTWSEKPDWRPTLKKPVPVTSNGQVAASIGDL